MKVQFPWDREGRHDEFSTCWIRVAQNWALMLERLASEMMLLVVGRALEAVVPLGLSSRTNIFAVAERMKHRLRVVALRLGAEQRPEGGKPRGEGFELRTDEHGAVRAAKGLLLSTEEQLRAGAGHLDRGVVVQVLEAALASAAPFTSPGDRDLIRDRQQRLLDEQRKRLEELQQLPGKGAPAAADASGDDERCFESRAERGGQRQPAARAGHREGAHHPDVRRRLPDPQGRQHRAGHARQLRGQGGEAQSCRPYGQQIEILQGVEIGRPSRMYARAEGAGERVSAVEVSGNGAAFAEGRAYL